MDSPPPSSSPDDEYYSFLPATFEEEVLDFSEDVIDYAEDVIDYAEEEEFRSVSPRSVSVHCQTRPRPVLELVSVGKGLTYSPISSSEVWQSFGGE